MSINYFLHPIKTYRKSSYYRKRHPIEGPNLIISKERLDEIDAMPYHPESKLPTFEEFCQMRKEKKWYRKLAKMIINRDNRKEDKSNA